MTSQFPDFLRRFERQMADYQERMAERIVRAREVKGYDREPFALMAGISPKQLQRIEEGTSIPRAATVRKIAEAAGVEISYIKPDLEAEENELREQLDRIEAKLDRVLSRLPGAEEALDEDLEGEAGRSRGKAASGARTSRARQRKAR